MTAETILANILESKPALPSIEVLDEIAFQWNEEGLSCWDGGEDLHEDLRSEVVELLEPHFESKDPDFLPVLRFLIQQESRNSRESETCTSDLRPLYEYLAAYRRMEDVVLLLDAVQNTSFDASLALDKDRLFWNGYQEVIEFVRANYENGEDLVESLAFFGDYFGFDQPGWRPTFPDQEIDES
jgi:hypothetical protein